MKLDPNAVDDNDFPVYPEGDYDFEVENTTYQQNKNKTGYQWKVQFRIDAEGGKTFKVWVPERQRCCFRCSMTCLRKKGQGRSI